MVILDFYGLPGSGKSTISHMLAERLRDEGYSVSEPSWTLDNKDITAKRLLKKLILAVLYEMNNPFVVKKCMSYASDLDCSFMQKIKLWVNFAYTLNYETRSMNIDYMIMDEGISQGVVSLFTSLQNANSLDCFEFLRKKMVSKLVFVYISVPFIEAEKRLLHRNTAQSRVDGLEGKERIDMLRHIEVVCKSITSRDTIEISNLYSVEDALDQLYERVKGQS